MPDVIRLRGHHLLCLLTFVGKGYTPRFIDNMHAIVARIAAGAAVMTVEGLDDICAALHDNGAPACASGAHCLKSDIVERDRVALATVGAALGIHLQIGSALNLASADYARLRRLFAVGTLRKACQGCEWHELCTGIARDGFKGTRLLPQEGADA